jgi:hypothetical protein
MCDVVLNENGKYEFIGDDENQSNDNEYHESPQSYHPTLYFSEENAKKILGYDKSIQLFRRLYISVHDQHFKVHCPSCSRNTIFDTRDWMIWRKFVKILLLSKIKMHINDEITTKNGVIYEYAYDFDTIKNYNGNDYIARLQKIYHSPYPIDGNYNTLKLLFEESLYKLVSGYVAIEAKSLKYFYDNTSAISKSEKLTDISFHF